MLRTSTRRHGAIVAVAAMTLFAAGCGDSDDGPVAQPTTTTPSTDTTTTTPGSTTAAAPATTAHGDAGHGMDEGDGGHDHGSAPLEVPAASAPGLTLEVTADPGGGWNVHAVPTGHTLAPERASTDHAEGEGHMHLYVDGDKVNRMYGEWYHLGDLDPGTHEVRVELSANDHRPLAVDGEIIDEAATIEVVAGGGDEGHSHDEVEPVEADGVAVSLEVHADPKEGWNIHATPTGFVLAPEHASTEHVEGEGHMHLYVDGHKVNRMYGEWYHLGPLGPGSHEITVELTSNDHRPLAVDGQIVAASTTITGAGDATDDDHDMDDMDDMDGAGDAMVDDHDGPVIEITSGEDATRHSVSVGDDVLVIVTGDVTDDVHLHGYDVLAAIAPGEPAVLMFTADIPGVFEIELEGSGTLLAELEVR